jgi:hypothetical protein
MTETIEPKSALDMGPEEYEAMKRKLLGLNPKRFTNRERLARIAAFEKEREKAPPVPNARDLSKEDYAAALRKLTRNNRR